MPTAASTSDNAPNTTTVRVTKRGCAVARETSAVSGSTWSIRVPGSTSSTMRRTTAARDTASPSVLRTQETRTPGAHLSPGHEHVKRGSFTDGAKLNVLHDAHDFPPRHVVGIRQPQRLAQCRPIGPQHSSGALADGIATPLSALLAGCDLSFAEAIDASERPTADETNAHRIEVAVAHVVRHTRPPFIAVCGPSSPLRQGRRERIQCQRNLRGDGGALDARRRLEPEIRRSDHSTYRYQGSRSSGGIGGNTRRLNTPVASQPRSNDMSLTKLCVSITARTTRIAAPADCAAISARRVE